MAKRLMYKLVAFLLVVFLCSCSTSNRWAKAIEPSNPGAVIESNNPTIGLLSDSQIQTSNAFKSVGFYKGKVVDDLVKVTLRPPALNKAAPSLLRSLLKKMAVEEIDILIYLGDGANNGCEDEILDDQRGYLKILREFRENHNIPVFVIVGNHDYLGAGNTPNKLHRQQLCDDKGDVTNKPLSKFEVIKLISNLNRESVELLNKLNRNNIYRDSIDLAINRCHAVEKEGNHHKTSGCFIAGYLAIDEIEILLLDTSDYSDSKVKPKLSEELQLFGTRGSVSFYGDDSQQEWFDSILHTNKSPSYRLIASHYPISELRLGVGNVKFSRQVGRIGNLIRVPSNKSVYWLSGHTHVPEPTYSDKTKITEPCTILTFWKCWFGKKTIVEEINVGSTTDWEPHGLVLQIDNKGKLHPRRIVLGDLSEKRCMKLLDNLNSSNAINDNLIEIEGYPRESWLGITRSYRDPRWSTEHTHKAVENIEKLKSSRGVWAENCLGLEASKREGK